MTSTDEVFRVRIVTRWPGVAGAAARSIDAVVAAAHQSPARGRVELVVGESPPTAGKTLQAGDGGDLEAVCFIPPREAPPAVILNELALGPGPVGSRPSVVVFLEPGAVMSPFTLSGLLAALADPTTAIAGARLLPLGEDTGFDPLTGESNWVSAAAMAVQSNDFEKLDGFDALRFPDSGFDIDLCWRARLAGHRVVLVPDAPVFRRLIPGPDGSPPLSPDDERRQFLGRLTLAGRYGLTETVDHLLDFADTEGGDGAREAALEWRTRTDPLAVLDAPGAAAFDGLVPGVRPVP